MCFYSHNSPPLPSVSVSSPMTINTVSYFPLTHIIVIISAVMGCRFSNMQPIFVSENTNKYIFFSPGELPGLGLIQIYDSTLFQPGLGRPSIVIKYNLTHQIQWERKVLRPVHKTWRRDIITDFIIIQLNKTSWVVYIVPVLVVFISRPLSMWWLIQIWWRPGPVFRSLIKTSPRYQKRSWRFY